MFKNVLESFPLTDLMKINIKSCSRKIFVDPGSKMVKAIDRQEEKDYKSKIHFMNKTKLNKNDRKKNK